MTDTSHKRKLAAIMFADMAGYTALSHENESLALELVEELRGLVRSSLSARDGTLVKEMGDGFLLTFNSGLAAVQCARFLQMALAERNRMATVERRIGLRLGIHLGDVESREGDVFGSGVNLAQRVMSEAKPGEICLTQPVFDQLNREFKQLIVARGSRQFKNIPQPVAVYAIPAAGEKPASSASRWFSPRRAVWLLLSLPVLAAAALICSFWPAGKPGAAVRATAGIQLAVLPFHNVGEDAEVAAFSDGLVETLCGKLIQMAQYQPALRVVPMTEVRAQKISTPGEALKLFGATRVLTGSVQRVGPQVKVVLTLLDSTRGQGMASDSKTRMLEDAFGLQEELATLAVTLLGIKPPIEAAALLRAGGTEKGEAYFAYLKGLGLLARYDRVENLTAAKDDLEEAVRLDPKFASAHACLAEAYWRLFNHTKATEWKDRALAQAAKATEYGPDLPGVHMVLGLIDTDTGKWEEAIAEFQKAARQDAANPNVQFGLARVYSRLRRDKEAEEAYLQAIERNTNYWAGYNRLAAFYADRGEYARAETNYLRAAEITPDNYIVYLNLGGIYLYMGRRADAHKALLHSIDLHPTADAYSNLGSDYFGTGNYTAASEMYEHAVSMNTNDPTLWGNWADARRLTAQPAEKVTAAYERARELTEALLQINPKDALLRAQMAYYLAYVGKPREALAAAALAREQSPDDMNISFISALVCERANQREKALAELQVAAAGKYSPSEITNHPDLADLRLDRRFAPIKDLLNSPDKKEQQK